MPFNNAVDAKQTGYQSLTSGGVWNGRTFIAGSGISISNADGTAGNTTITATGMTPDPFGTLYLIDDFLYSTTSDVGDTNWDTQNTTDAGTVPAGHPGVIRIGGTGSTSFITKASTVSALGCITLGGGSFVLDFLVRIPTLNASTMYIGLGAGSFSAEPTDGCYFLYSSGTNSGAWVGKTANASSRSTANSANTVVSNQWDRLTITINAAATSVAFFVNNVQITNSPLAANIPTAELDIRVGATNVANNAIDIDLFVITNVLTTPR